MSSLAVQQAPAPPVLEMTFHPLCDLIPAMEPEQYAALVKNIAKNGLNEEIWTLPDNLTIISGKARYSACKEAGVTPRYRVRSDTDLQSLREFVLSENLHRRHLTASQRAAFAAALMPQLKEAAKSRMSAGGGDQKSGTEKVPAPIADIGEAREKAAVLANVNPHYISDAVKIADADTDLLKEVQAGKITIPAAKKKLAAKKPSAKSAPKKGAKPASPNKIKAPAGAPNPILFKRAAEWLHGLSDEARLGAAAAALKAVRPFQGKLDGTYPRNALSLIFGVDAVKLSDKEREWRKNASQV